MTRRVRTPSNPLQVMLVEIWASVLGDAPRGVDQSFAELGGTRADLDRMLARAASACGRPVPAHARRHEVTIEELAVALHAPEPADGPGRRLVVARNVGPGAHRRPLFFLHGDYAGGGLYCLRLAVHLGRDQPLYGIAPHGHEGEALPPTIEAMAADRLRTIRALQPSGPYWLGGYCNGAVVAFEIARQLQAEGERVERLVLVAPVVFAPRADGRWAGVATTLRRGARRLRSGLPDTRAALRWRVARLWERHGPALRVWLGGAWQDPTSRAAVVHDWVFEAHARRIRAYWPLPYAGAVTVLHPVAEPLRAGAEPGRVWPRLAERVEVHPVPGAHFSCITVHVRELAERIRTCLDAPGERA